MLYVTIYVSVHERHEQDRKTRKQNKTVVGLNL